MNKYGTLTEFPMGIVRKARGLNIKDTRGTRNFGSLKTPTSSVAKNGGNMNLEVNKLKSEIVRLKSLLHGKNLDLKKAEEVRLKLVKKLKDKEPLVLTKEMEVKDE